MWQLCLTGEQTSQSQKQTSVYWGQYPSVAPGASAQVELIWRREISGEEVERKREDFYRASKEVMKLMNLATKKQRFTGKSHIHEADWLLLWDMREMWEMIPSKYQLPVAHRTLSFFVLRLGTEVKFTKWKRGN